MISMPNGFTTKIERADFYKENDRYYLDVLYLLEDDRKIVSLHIPKLIIPLEDFKNINLGDPHSFDPECFVTLENHIELIAESCELPNNKHCTYEYKIIKEKPVKMTVEEIEKKLGYKVEIISKGESK